MIAVFPSLFQGLCMRQGLFTIPSNIRSAIENSVANTLDAVTVEYKKLSDSYKNYRTLMMPANIDYHGTLTIDAYVTYYLPRNVVIPWIALRDLSLHPFFRQLPNRINVLDLGSGTGAVNLGLLHLFHNKPFSDGAVTLTALDCHAEALQRQADLIRGAGFNSSVTLIESDLSDVDSYMSSLKMLGHFHFIFIANCLTELSEHLALQLLSRLPEILDDKGAIVIAEAQRDYVKRMVATLAKSANEYNLHVYYPCPNFGCKGSNRCWVWRDHRYEFPDLKIGGQPVTEDTRERLTLSWLILTKQRLSMYDVFRTNDPSLTWGPIAQEKYWDRQNKRVIFDPGACNSTQVLIFKKDSAVSLEYERGSVVGLSSTGQLKAYHGLS